MENEALHSQILNSLGKLEGKQETGFSGVHQRLDVLNGKVSKHEGQLQQIAIQDTKVDAFLETLKSSQRKESTFRSKWLDRILMIVFMAIIQGVLLLFIRSGILNLEKTPTNVNEITERAIQLNAEASKLQLELQKQGMNK